MLICYMMIVILVLGIFVGTLKIKTKNDIFLPAPSVSSIRGQGQLPSDFDFWN